MSTWLDKRGFRLLTLLPEIGIPGENLPKCYNFAAPKAPASEKLEYLCPNYNPNEEFGKQPEFEFCHFSSILMHCEQFCTRIGGSKAQLRNYRK